MNISISCLHFLRLKLVGVIFVCLFIFWGIIATSGLGLLTQESLLTMHMGPYVAVDHKEVSKCKAYSNVLEFLYVIYLSKAVIFLHFFFRRTQLDRLKKVSKLALEKKVSKLALEINAN